MSRIGFGHPELFRAASLGSLKEVTPSVKAESSPFDSCIVVAMHGDDVAEIPCLGICVQCLYVLPKRVRLSEDLFRHHQSCLDAFSFETSTHDPDELDEVLRVEDCGGIRLVKGWLVLQADGGDLDARLFAKHPDGGNDGLGEFLVLVIIEAIGCSAGLPLKARLLVVEGKVGLLPCGRGPNAEDECFDPSFPQFTEAF